MRALRSAYAHAAGVVTRGRCTTIVIALRWGSSNDPALTQPLLLITEYIAYWLANPDMHGAIAEAWPRLVALHSPRPSWKAVRGPLLAAVATAVGCGWATVAPDFFIDPDGGKWHFVHGSLTSLK